MRTCIHEGLGEFYIYLYGIEIPAELILGVSDVAPGSNGTFMELKYMVKLCIHEGWAVLNCPPE